MVGMVTVKLLIVMMAGAMLLALSISTCPAPSLLIIKDNQKDGFDAKPVCLK